MTAHAGTPDPTLAGHPPRTIDGGWSLLAIDLRSLALFRVAISAVLLFLFGCWGWSFVSVPGVNVASTWGLMLHAAALGLLAVSALTLLIGWASRSSALLAFTAVLVVNALDPATTSPGVTLLRLTLLWAALLPLGDRYAVDTAVAGPAFPQPRTAGIATLGVLLLLLVAHLDPSAISDRAQLRSVTPLARMIEAESWLPARLLWTEAVEALGFGTLILALAFSGAPRAAAVVIMATLHVILGFVLEAGLLPFVIAALWLLLLPSAEWDRLRDRCWTPERRRVRFWHSDRDETQIARVRLLQTFLLLPRETAAPTSEDIDMDVFRRQRDSWVVSDAEGYRFVKFHALAAAVGASPLFWPLSLPMRMGFIESVGDWVYDLTKRRRGPVVAMTGRASPRRHTLFHAVLGGALLAALLAWQLWFADRPLPAAGPWLHEWLRLTLGG